ncbi:MAG: hypothetical protein SFU85_02915 [Candidatus Methylacidiphilales bacterium]|nr:hypothetical protein [Candidatus Methylacidiphilales bacterium]
MKKNTPINNVSPGIIAFLFLFLVGCADLKGIRKFADTGADSTSYNAFVTDYSGTVLRRKEYAPGKEQIESIHVEYERRIKDQKRLLELNKTVTDYMAALAALASDETIDFSAESKELGGSLEKIGYLDKKETAAATALFDLIAKAASEGYRQGKLKEIIKNSNADLQVLLGSIQQIVGTAYVQSLDSEKLALSSAYQGPSMTDLTKENAAVVLPLRSVYFSRLTKLESQKEAAIMYSQAIGIIAKAHQKLYDERNKMSLGRLSTTVEFHAKQAKALYEAAKELLKKE